MIIDFNYLFTGLKENSISFVILSVLSVPESTNDEAGNHLCDGLWKLDGGSRMTSAVGQLMAASWHINGALWSYQIMNRLINGNHRKYKSWIMDYYLLADRDAAIKSFLCFFFNKNF